MIEFKNNFSKKLKELIQDKKLGQQEFADAIGKSRGTIVNWISGKTLPDIEDGILLAQYFNIKIDDFVNELLADGTVVAEPEGVYQLENRLIINFGHLKLSTVTNDANEPLMGTGDLVSIEPTTLEAVRDGKLVRVVLDRDVKYGIISIEGDSIKITKTNKAFPAQYFKKSQVKSIGLVRAIWKRMVV